MRAHPLARLLLAGAGIAVALAATRGELALMVPAIGVGFVACGTSRLAGRLVVTLLPVIGFSALLWLYVNGAEQGSLAVAILALVDDNAPFLKLLRTAAGSCVIVLALGTIPDGELFGVLRRLGVPVGPASIIASGAAVAAGMGDAFIRSIVAMRAHGVVGPGRFSQLRHLGEIVSLTWTSALSEVVVRSEITWAANGLLESMPVVHPGQISYEWRGSLGPIALAFVLLALLVGSWS